MCSCSLPRPSPSLGRHFEMLIRCVILYCCCCCVSVLNLCSYRSQPRPIRHFYHRRARDENGGWVWVRDSQLNSVHGRFTVVHYFYSKLEPWNHYVPLNRDLSDVVGKMQWAREHDEEVSRLGVGSSLVPDPVRRPPFYSPPPRVWKRLHPKPLHGPSLTRTN